MAEVSDLKPAPYNPRKITDEKLELLRRGMAAFGDLSGIVFNRTTQRLVGGHQRVKHFDPSSDVTIVTKYDPPTQHGTVAEGYILYDGERWSYREVEWDDEQHEAAANIAANLQGGEFDWPSLTEIVSDLEGHGYDANLVGFTDTELERILTGFADDAFARSGDLNDEADGFAGSAGGHDYDHALIQMWIPTSVFEGSPDLKSDLDQFAAKHGVEWETRMKRKKD